VRRAIRFERLTTTTTFAALQGESDSAVDLLWQKKKAAINQA